MPKNFKEWSKEEFVRTDDQKPTAEQVQIGCLQRISDAVEKIAQNYDDLLREKEKFKRWYLDERAEKERLQRSIIAHKANYTRLKNKMEAIKQDETN